MKKLASNNDIRYYALLTAAAVFVTLVLLITGGYVKEGYEISVGSVSDYEIKAPRQIENKVLTERLRKAAEDTVTPKYAMDMSVTDAVNAGLDDFFNEMDRLRELNVPIFTPSRNQMDMSSDNIQNQTGADANSSSDAIADNDEDENAEGETAVPAAVMDNMPVGAELGNTPDFEADNNPALSQSGGDINNSAGSSYLTQEENMMSAINGSSVIVNFSYENLYYIVRLRGSEYEFLEERVRSVINETLSFGVQNEAMQKTLVDMKSEYDIEFDDYDSRLSKMAYEISAVYLMPNMLYDEEATLKLKEEKRNEVKPEYYLAGEVIVAEGRRISEEAYSAIESLGLLSGGYKENIPAILGVSGIALVAFAITYLYIYYYAERILKNKKEALLLFTIYLVVIFAAKLMAASSQWVFVPVLAFTMLSAVLLDIQLAIVANMGVAVITMFIVNKNVDYLMFFMSAGTVNALISRYLSQRNNVFFISLAASVSNAFLFIAIALVIERNMNRELAPEFALRTAYAFLNAMFTVMITVGSLPLWEALFGVVTSVKLLDLTNPDNKLLRRLTIEAPGTYHHSLIVANLSETAAVDTGANPNVARVGGYYHDIGKLKYPQYFSENQVGENPHDELDPYSSIAVINSHIAVGLQYADEYKLPKAVKDIIAQHHGNTLIKYFYYKAKKEAPEDDVNESDFRYKQSTPQSKEAAIVMLADTVEAAVRSKFKESKSMEEIEEFTRALIKDKLDDGQLIDSGLTIKDIDTVAKSFMRVFKGMYHERIPYPTAVR